MGIIVLVAGWWWTTTNRGDTIVYRGEKIKLSKRYADFDQYKNDPDNIAASETKHVQTLVITAPIAHSFASSQDLFRAVEATAFPGYGTGIFPSRKSDEKNLTLVTIEIPRANEDRFLVVQRRKGGFEIVEDFVHADPPMPFGVREESGSYVFLDGSGNEIFRRSATGTADQ